MCNKTLHAFLVATFPTLQADRHVTSVALQISQRKQAAIRILDLSNSLIYRENIELGSESNRFITINYSLTKSKTESQN